MCWRPQRGRAKSLTAFEPAEVTCQAFEGSAHRSHPSTCMLKSPPCFVPFSFASPSLPLAPIPRRLCSQSGLFTCSCSRGSPGRAGAPSL
eukprot:2503228-Pyramimonas_sp.AAC.1